MITTTKMINELQPAIKANQFPQTETAMELMLVIMRGQILTGVQLVLMKEQMISMETGYWSQGGKKFPTVSS